MYIHMHTNVTTVYVLYECVLYECVLLASYPARRSRAKERTPGFSHLRMREVNYFYCSIILHSDVTIVIVFN